MRKWLASIPAAILLQSPAMAATPSILICEMSQRVMAIAEQHLVDGRTGRNGRHDLVGMLRQSVFGRLSGYEDVNDADRLGRLQTGSDR